MAKAQNNYKQLLDEQNRQIILHKIERNRILEENGEPSDSLLPEYRLDYNAKIISVNQKLAEILEYSSAEELMEAVNAGVYLFMKSDLITLFAKDDYVIDRPFFVHTKTGVLLNLRESMIKCQQGNQIYYVGLINFVETSEPAKQSAIEERNLFHQAYDNVKAGVFTCDSHCRVLYLNPAMRHFIGYEDGEIFPSSYLSDYLSPENYEKASQTVEKLYQNNIPTKTEIYSIARKDGEIIEVSVYSYMFHRDRGSFCVSVVSPIEANIKVSNQEEHILYWQTINSLSEMYILLSPEGEIRDINNSAIDLWGWDYDVYLTKSIFDLGSFDVADLKSCFRSLLEDMKPIDMEFSATHTKWGDVKFKARLVAINCEDKKFVSMILENTIEIKQMREKLNAEYKNNMALFDNSLCGIIQIEKNRVVKANSMVYSLLRIKNDLRGELFSNVFKEIKRKKRRIATTASNRKEEVSEYEIVVNRKHILFELHIFDIDRDNSLCYFMDITPRKSVSVSQTEASSRYKAIVEQSPCGVLIGDSHGDIIDVSDRFCEIIKMPPTEILGKNIMALFTSQSVSSKPFDYTRVDAGNIISAERDLQCGDGTFKVVEMYSCAISNDMYQAVVMDITQRKMYETQMNEYRKRANRLEVQKTHFLKMANGVTIVFGKDCELKDIFVGKNSPLYYMSKDEDDAINTVVKIISSKEYGYMIRECVRRILQSPETELNSNGVYSVHFNIPIGNKTYILEASYSPMGDDIVLAISDITERENMMNDLQEALKKSEENEKLQRAMLGNLSHEVRTPMNGIIGFADLLLEMEDDEEKRDYLQTILNSSNQLMNVLNDMIEMSKLDAGVVKINTEIVSLKSLFATIYDALHSMQWAKSNNVELVNLTSGKGDIRITTDIVKMRQVITNLITNAFKFTKDGKVEIDYRDDGDKVCLSVRDNGIGIAEEDLKKIFERYFQAKQGKEIVVKGSGVGLSIVKSYVEMLHGAINVESELGKGSCFYVILPKSF